MMKNRALFLDRDGTLNPDPGYIRDPSQISLFDGVIEGLIAAKKMGFKLIIVTNQSGVGRGLITGPELDKVHDRLHEIFFHNGCSIDAIYSCTHRPDEFCKCRKPETGLITQAASDLNIDIGQSYMIGDRDTDLLVAQNAKCKGFILVGSGHGRETYTNLMGKKPLNPFIRYVETLRELEAAIRDQDREHDLKQSS